MSELIILMNHNGKQPHSPAISKCKFNQHLQFDCFKTIQLKKLSFVGGKFSPTRMHSSRMRTARATTGRISYRTPPLLPRVPPSPHK